MTVARPPLTCPRCGEVVPSHVRTEQVGGRSVRECRHCGFNVSITEAIVNA